MPPDSTGADKRTQVAVFFSFGTSFTTWQEAGLSGRETAYLRALGERAGAVAAVTYGRGSEAERRLEAQARVATVQANRLRLPSAVYSLLAPLLHYRALRRASVLRATQLRGAWTAALAKKLTGRPLVVRAGYAWSAFNVRTNTPWWRRRLVKWLEGFAIRTADVVLVATTEDGDYLASAHGVPRERFHLLPNPVDTGLFAPSATASGQDHGGQAAAREPIVAFVGRLEPQKNVAALIEAMRRIPDARLVIAGDGSQREDLERRAAGFPVQFTGVIPNAQLPGLLRGSDVFVLPSLYEGSPKALLEAMACGLAVVAADVPGTRGTVAHGVTGLLADPDPEALAAQIELLLSDTALRARLGAAARQYAVKHHSMAAVADAEARVLRTVAGRDESVPVPGLLGEREGAE